MVICKTETHYIFGSQKYVAKKMCLDDSTLTRRFQKENPFVDENGNRWSKVDGFITKRLDIQKVN